jgi:hypothetical protein
MIRMTLTQAKRQVSEPGQVCGTVQAAPLGHQQLIVTVGTPLQLAVTVRMVMMSAMMSCIRRIPAGSME